MNPYLLYCADLNEGDALLDKDKRRAQRLGAWLAGEGKAVSKIICPDTGEYPELSKKLAKAMNCAENLVEPMKNQDLSQLLLEKYGKNSHVLVIHHTDRIGQFCRFIDGHWKQDLDSGTFLETTNKGHIHEQFNVKTLPKKFPFPSPDGKELRDRPAYYYRQSAVIPYQQQGDDIRILIIGSSKQKHLVVPKGIHEPGLSAQASAAKESLEEAGVRGEVKDVILGCYEYEKWGAVCRVEVYPQLVCELIAEEAWQERHRGRQWMTPEEAASQVRERSLASMIMKLQELLNKGVL